MRDEEAGHAAERREQQALRERLRQEYVSR